MITKTKEEIKEIFQSQIEVCNIRRYKKDADVLWRGTVPGETVITICGGKIETIRTIKINESNTIVIMNIQIGSSAEQYIIQYDKFLSRYDITDDVYNINGQRWELAKAKGEVEGFSWFWHNSCKFMAPWGEEMLINNEDMLVRSVGSEDDIYRIAIDEFNLTYKLKENK